MPQVQAELDTIAARIARQYPKEEEKLTFKLTRPGLMGDFFGAPARAFLAGVLGLAGIVLLAACANLGSLFAARTADRTREIAIRMAIGSSRWRVIRQILVEAIVISICGGACACVLAWIALTGLANWHPPTEYPMNFSVVHPQPSLILMGLLISVLAGVVFGVMPLRQIFKTDPNEAIKSGGIQSSAAGRRWALRDVLLAAQVALCCVTVTAAFVSLRGLGRAMTMNMGINPKHAVLTKFELSQAGYSNEAADHFQRQLLEKVSHLPGVDAAAYGTTTPLSMDTSDSNVFSQQTTDFRPSKRAFDAYDYFVSPGYFTAAGTPLLAGRDVSFADTAKTPAVAVVNREFARRLFHTDAHSAAAVGRYFKNSSGESIQIVGIVADGKYFSLTEDQEAVAFFPISQHATAHTSFIVRMRPDSSDAATNDMAGTIAKVVRDLDPAIPIRTSSRLEKPTWTDVLCIPGGDRCPRPLWCVWIAALDHGNFRPRVVHRQQAAARIEYSGCARCADEAGSLGGARSYADPARQRVGGWDAARRRREPGTFRDRLPRVRAGSIRTCCRCVNAAAHGIAFGSGSGKTRAANRPGKRAPRTVIFRI